jgi:hypothetical protein
MTDKVKHHKSGVIAIRKNKKKKKHCHFICGLRLAERAVAGAAGNSVSIVK